MLCILCFKSYLNLLTVNKEFFDPLMLEHALSTLLESMGVNVIESSVDNITEEENEEFMNKMCQ